MRTAWTDGGVRLSAVWRGDRVTVDLWRQAARGWVGTGAMVGTRVQVLDWLSDRHWPDARPFLSRLRGWLDRTGPVEAHVAGWAPHLRSKALGGFGRAVTAERASGRLGGVLAVLAFAGGGVYH